MWSRFLIGYLLFAIGHLSAEIIPSYRRTEWTNAGVRGGIPDSSAMTVYTNCGAGVTLAQLNAVLQSCPSNQVVQLTNGTFTFTGRVEFERAQGVVLRGNGAANTRIVVNADAGCIGVGLDNDRVNPAAGNIKAVTGGLTQGSTSIVLTNVSNLPPIGRIIVIDQLDGGIIKEDLQEGCSWCSRDGGTRGFQQWCIITSSNNNTVGIWPPLYSCLWNYAQSPEAFWTAEDNTRHCGVESLSVTNQAETSKPAIGFSEAVDCWAKDVNIYKSPQTAFECLGSVFIEVRRCGMLSGIATGGMQSYGFVVYQSSACLMIDSVAANVTGAVNWGPGAQGSVVAYSYFTNLIFAGDWDIAALASHDVHTTMNLYEGNWANKVYYDTVHGSGSHMTDLRNRYHGLQVGRGQNTKCYDAEGWILSNNVVGNILGTVDYHTNYDVTLSVEEHNNLGTWSVFVLGNYKTPDPEALPVWDDRVAPSTLIHGNWTTSIDKPGQQWDSGISDHTIPNSYFLSSKPSWFGFLPWPPYDPANVTAASIDPTNLPAAYRYYFGTNPPAGPPDESPGATNRLRATNLRVTGSIRGN